MTDQLISFETAKLAKEKGLNLNFPTAVYIEEGDLWISQNLLNERITGKPFPKILFTAPTQSLLQKWLREEHKIHIVVIPFARDSSNIKSKSDYYVYVNKKQFYGFINITANDKPYKTHEEALEQGLIEALKLIK